MNLSLVILKILFKSTIHNERRIVDIHLSMLLSKNRTECMMLCETMQKTFISCHEIIFEFNRIRHKSMSIY